MILRDAESNYVATKYLLWRLYDYNYTSIHEVWGFLRCGRVDCFWVFTYVSIARNSWFDFFRDAFSDLGGSRASDPWIYYTSLVISSIALLPLSLHIIATSRNRIGVVSGSYFSVASIFLALIAIYPAGTRPHVFVSTWFFVQAFLSILIYGFSRVDNPKILIASLAIFVLAILGTLIKRSSAACLETYEISLLTIFAVIYDIESRELFSRRELGKVLYNGSFDLIILLDVSLNRSY